MLYFRVKSTLQPVTSVFSAKPTFPSLNPADLHTQCRLFSDAAAPQCNQISADCFQPLTKCFSRNPFPLTFIRNTRGYTPSAPEISLLPVVPFWDSPRQRPPIGPAPQLCDNPGLALPRPSRLT